MYIDNFTTFHFILQVYKLEGSKDKYLFLNSKKFSVSWIVWSSLKGEEGHIASASSGQPCPAHSRNSINTKEGFKDWLFNAAKGRKFNWKKGGVAIKCSVHEN